MVGGLGSYLLEFPFYVCDPSWVRAFHQSYQIASLIGSHRCLLPRGKGLPLLSRSKRVRRQDSQPRCPIRSNVQRSARGSQPFLWLL
jgi:hypothetical protein